MIPNLVTTVAGIGLAFATILHPTWIEQQYLPMGIFAIVIVVMSLWARRTDAHPWFSNVNIVLGVLLGILSLLPLPTLPNLTFWGGFWIGSLAPCVALWAAIYHPKTVASAS